MSSNLTLSVDTQERFEARERRPHGRKSPGRAEVSGQTQERGRKGRATRRISPSPLIHRRVAVPMNKSGRGSDGRKTLERPGGEGPKPANEEKGGRVIFQRLVVGGYPQ